MKRREIRCLAMQALYIMDVRGETDELTIRAGLADALGAVRDGEDADEPVAEPEEELCNSALELAQGAWQCHGDADALIAGLSPKWPTHRQPPVDRAILRLAYHEIVSGHAPMKVAINEAIELSKSFCAEQSPAFINGVLDKLAKRLEDSPPPEVAAPEAAAPTSEDDN